MVWGAGPGSLKSQGHRLWLETNWPPPASLAECQECRGHCVLVEDGNMAGRPRPWPAASTWGCVGGWWGKWNPDTLPLAPWNPATNTVAQPHRFCCFRVTLISISKFGGIPSLCSLF